jgi:hypothetical protein
MYETISRAIEDDATARPILILMSAHNGTRRCVLLARTPPASPNLVMAGTKGQAIAV